MARAAVTPAGLNHLVLNVRDMEESHRFWTEILGFQQVGQLHATPQRPNPPNMRFYSGDHATAAMNHHDVALVENTSLPAPPAEWSMFGMPCAINHIAIALPSREAWLEQLAYLQEKGVKFDRRVEHGMTHSLYIHDPNGYGVELLYELPREVWGGDIDAALNFAVALPTEGKEALEDRTEDVPVFGHAEAVVVLRVAAMLDERTDRGAGARLSRRGKGAPAHARAQHPASRLQHRGRLCRPAQVDRDQGGRGRRDQGPQDRPDVARDAAPGQHHRTGLRRAAGGHVLRRRRAAADEPVHPAAAGMRVGVRHRPAAERSELHDLRRAERGRLRDAGGGDRRWAHASGRSGDRTAGGMWSTASPTTRAMPRWWWAGGRSSRWRSICAGSRCCATATASSRNPASPPRC